MTQTVELPDELVREARRRGELASLSPEEQIVLWVELGRSLDKAVREDGNGSSQTLAESLAEVGTPAGRERLRQFLASEPFPHYQQADQPGNLVKIDEDGTRTVGRFVGREFQPLGQ